VGSVLPPYIIEQIRRREEEQRKQHREQPQIEIPLPSNMPRPSAPDPENDDRGVIIIDL
jgi:hypothetical protein